MKKTKTFEIAFVILFVIAIILQIFVPPHVGVADNGDFSRIADKVGIQSGPDKKYYEFINLTLPLDFKYNIKGYQSSELLFVVSSIFANNLLTSDGNFHFLILAGLHSLLLLFAVILLAVGISGIAHRIYWVIYVVILFFFTDVAYIAYLNSLYSEPSSLIFLALTIGIFLWIIRSLNNNHEQNLFPLLAFFASAFLFTIAKPQNAAMGIPLAFLGYRLFTTVNIKRLAPKPRNWIGGFLALCLMGASFIFFAFGLPRYYRSGDLWNSIFMEIIGKSYTPEQDLKDLGLPPEMIVYQGTNAFSPGVNRNAYESFQHSWLYFDIAKFYATHPTRLFTLIDETAHSALQLQQSNLGNFPADVGKKAYEKGDHFALWNKLRAMILPPSGWTLAVLLGINLIVLIIRWLKYTSTPADRLINDLHLVLIAMAVVQYLTVIMAEGTYEVVKHMYLFNILVDCCLVILIANFAGWIAQKIHPERISTMD